MCLNQMDSQVALVNNLYLVSMDDKETVGCFLLLHDTTLEPMLISYPEVDFMSSGLPAQSESK